ncbi:hypothetical protein [Pseudoalteromonas sp. T1lg76]|uniref:hypothetical protein n=1 Tax=Pseudoalteromonas sp. T1lg76 TaxID=2077103 RepID=UPI000CF74758|nr:hypothetical protein [Pseudoalteromonas sp. T1lg76]
MKKLYLLLIGLSVVATLVFLYSPKSPPPTNDTVFNQPADSTDYYKAMDPLNSAEQLPDENKISINTIKASGITIKLDDRIQHDDASSIDNLINNLSSNEGGLSDTSIETAFRLKNFDSLVYQLQSTGINQEFEQQFRNTVHDVAQSNNGMLPRSIGCNDEVCAAVLDYSQQDSPEQFSKDLIQRIEQPISIVMQPVEVQGVKELRVILNYKDAKIIVK